jgi:hypothetical protein
MLRDGSIGMNDTMAAAGMDGHGARCAEVHQRLKRIARARGSLDAQEAAALRDAQQLVLWRAYGYASLAEYMELELGYSPRAALERLRVANVIVDLPAIAEALDQGDLPFSAARELTRVVTPETEGEWIDACAGKNLRDIEAMVAEHDTGDRPSDPPKPRARKRRISIEVDADVIALMRQAQQVLERERGERLDEAAVLAAAFRAVIDGGCRGDGDDDEAHGRAPYQIAITTCDTCKRAWQDGGGVSGEISPAALERARCDAQELGRVDAEQPERASQTIPPATRRLVLRRDRGTCKVPWCRSWRNIDVHHVVHREHGGTHDPLNLACLCEAHHLALHDGTLAIGGTAPDWTFERRPHGVIDTASRAADTTKALRGLGFSKDEVATAVNAARAHVGNAAATLEQWVMTALRFCPRPIVSS